MLLSHLEPRGFHFDRARSAREGLETLQVNGASAYRLIITDITMEGQMAGLRLIKKIRRNGFRGVLMVASTGFNSGLVLQLARFFMAAMGVDILVPKEPLKKGRLKSLTLSRRGKFWEAAYL